VRCELLPWPFGYEMKIILYTLVRRAALPEATGVLEQYHS